MGFVLNIFIEKNYHVHVVIIGQQYFMGGFCVSTDRNVHID